MAEKSFVEMVDDTRRDMATVGDFANIKNPDQKLESRLGNILMPLVALQKHVLDTGAQGFPDLVTLKKYVPSIPYALAKDMQTRKLWNWRRTSEDGVEPEVFEWEDTGKSDLDLANDHTDHTSSEMLYAISNTASAKKDFFTSVNQSQKVLINEDMREVKFAVERQEMDFHTDIGQSGIIIYNEKNQLIQSEASSREFDFYTNPRQSGIIIYNEKNQLIQSGGNDEGDTLLRENLTSLNTSMLATSEDPLFYRNGNAVMQKQRDYPDYYFLSYEELDCTSEGMYQKFDAIMADFPDLITRREIGRSVQDRPIYEYSITPVSMRPGDTMNLEHIKPITIAIYACVHGDEYAAVTGLYIWLQNLMRRWQELDDYGLHRYACQFKLVPCVNPDGMAIKTNNNANNVNLNRNFDSFWSSSVSNAGPYAASEPETQAIQNWFAEIDTEMFIDLHEGSVQELMWLGSYTDNGFGILNDVATKMTLFAFQNLNLAKYVNPDKTRLVYIGKSSEATAVNYLGNILKKNGILIESADRTHAMFKRDPQILREYTSKAISTIIESTRTKVQQDRYHGNFTH